MRLAALRIGMYRAACEKLPAEQPTHTFTAPRDKSQHQRRWSEDELQVMRDGLRRGAAPAEIVEAIPSRTYTAVLTQCWLQRQIMRRAQ